MTNLSIGYSTLAERIQNIRFPDGEYELLAFVQNPNSISFQAPSGLRVIDVAGRGVAKSRNQAINSCQTELLIFGDDDVVFDAAALEQAAEEFRMNPKLALLLMAATDEHGQSRKKYPVLSQKLNLFNCARAATYEIMIRPKVVKELGVRFDENFGAGAELYLGDEYIFIADLIKAGAQCQYSPIFVASHPSDSSGERWGTAADRKARAAVFSRVFGMAAPLVRFGFAIRRMRELGGLASAAAFVIGC